MVAAVGDYHAFFIAGRGVGETDDAGYVDACRCSGEIDGISDRNVTEVMDAVHRTAYIFGVDTADKGHMQVSFASAFIGHRCITRHVADSGVVKHAGNHAYAVGDRRGDGQRATLVDDEILNDGSWTEITEDAEVAAVFGFRIC